MAKSKTATVEQEQPLSEPIPDGTTAIAERTNGAIAEATGEPSTKKAVRNSQPREHCRNLSQALARAQEQCPEAIKDRYNEYRKFWYASAESVMRASKIAFAGTGIAVQSRGWTAKGSKECPLMEIVFYLVHESGEVSEDTPIIWPIITDIGGGKFMPLDDAFASTLTTARAQFVRHLLLMPYSAQHEDGAAREESTPSPGPPTLAAPTATAQAPQHAAPKAAPASAPAPVAAPAVTGPKTPLPGGPPEASTLQVRRIAELVGELGFTESQLKQWLMRHFGVSAASNLTSATASDAIGRLERGKEQKLAAAHAEQMNEQ